MKTAGSISSPIITSKYKVKKQVQEKNSKDRTGQRAQAGAGTSSPGALAAVGGGSRGWGWTGQVNLPVA